MAIEIWPAIDLLNGLPVRLEQGDYDRVTRYQPDVGVVAAPLEEHGIDRVHLVDLGGAKEGVFSAWDALSELVGRGFRVEVGGGFRDFAAIDRALSEGAERVVVGTQIVVDRAFAENLIRRFSPQTVVVGIDVKAGRARVKGWLEIGPDAFELWRDLLALGYMWLNVTDIDRDGSLSGVRPDFWKAWASQRGNIAAGGGISTVEDLRLLGSMGLARAVVGKAWLEGRIPLDILEGGD